MGLTNFPSDLTISLVLSPNLFICAFLTVCNPFHSQDLISNSPYYLPYSSCNVSLKISFIILLTICHTGLVMLV